MHIEFEIKFLGIDFSKFRTQMEGLGGTCIHEKILMRRVIFNLGEHEYVRVRDEGNKITCTYKNIDHTKLDISSVKELECEVSDFEVMRQIFTASGLREKAYQETYRETWKMLDGTEIMLDEWPGIEPFIEIEGVSEDIVREWVEKFGLSYEQGLFGAVDQICFRLYGTPRKYLNNYPLITFENPPNWGDSTLWDNSL